MDVMRKKFIVSNVHYVILDLLVIQVYGRNAQWNAHVEEIRNLQCTISVSVVCVIHMRKKLVANFYS